MKITSIIVFYNPTKEQVLNAERITEFCEVIVVDNSQKVLGESVRFKYVSNGYNIGIAAAQNRGISLARETRADRILFLDQDSLIDDESVLNLSHELDAIKANDPKAVAIGPLIVNKRTGNAYKNNLGSATHKAVPSIISSGMLVEMSAFDTVGMMEEDLFIDVVDHEWCWRCYSKGLHVYMTSNVVLMHEVGSNYQQFLGVQFIWSAPFRYYYKYRNYMWMLSRKYVSMSWKLKTFLRLSLDYMIFAVIGLLKPEKRGYITNATKGIMAGVKGRRE